MQFNALPVHRMLPTSNYLCWSSPYFFPSLFVVSNKLHFYSQYYLHIYTLFLEFDWSILIKFTPFLVFRYFCRVLVCVRAQMLYEILHGQRIKNEHLEKTTSTRKRSQYIFSHAVQTKIDSRWLHCDKHLFLLFNLSLHCQDVL